MTTTTSERKSSLSISGDRRIAVVTSTGHEIHGCSFDGTGVTHPSRGRFLTLKGEKAAELTEALAAARPAKIESRIGSIGADEDAAGWEYVGLTDESGEYMPIYRRVLDVGTTASVSFGPMDVVA